MPTGMLILESFWWLKYLWEFVRGPPAWMGPTAALQGETWLLGMQEPENKQLYNIPGDRNSN